MAQARKEGRDGIDKWTNNGHGMTIAKKTISQAQADAINKSIAEKRKRAK